MLNNTMLSVMAPISLARKKSSYARMNSPSNLNIGEDANIMAATVPCNQLESLQNPKLTLKIKNKIE